MGEPEIVIVGERPTSYGNVNLYVCNACDTKKLFNKGKGIVGYKMIEHLVFIHDLSKAEACSHIANAMEVK